MENIKKRLRILIRDNGGNATELASKIGVTPSHLASVVSDTKRGIPASVLIAIAGAGFDVQWLLTGESSISRIAELEEKLRDAHTLIDSLERILKS